MSNLLFDLRDALRSFRRDRLYVAAVIGTLALTLGALTAVFSIVNGVLLKPLAYPEPERLVAIRETVPRLEQHYLSLPVNARHFEHWRSQAQTFAAMAELDWRTTNLTGAGEPAQIVLLRASGTLFDVLGTRVAIGRGLTRDDERSERPAVTVISQRLWIDRLGRDPAIIGRSLTYGGAPYTVVGVLPEAYELPRLDVLKGSGSLTANVDAIVPMRINLANVDWMGQFNFPVIARVQTSAGLDQVRAEMNVLQHAVAQIAERETHEPTTLGATVTPLDEALVGRTRLGLLLLLGAIGAVLLIACSNLANLSLTRTLARMRDAAVRTALGASVARLVRQIVLEQVVLALAGAALGILVARQALALFVRTAPIDLPRVSAVNIDARVLAFAGASAVAAGLAVAILPSWWLGRAGVHGALRTGGHGATDRGGLRTRATLLAVQVALSVTLLAVTGLFTASFVHLLRIDPGFSTERVITIEIAPIARRYPDINARAALYDRILDAARGVPGITSLSWTSALPLTGETWVDLVSKLNDPRLSSQKPAANYRFIGPEYFRAMSMPLVKGRSIDARDRNRALTPAVISARTAQTLWPGEDPIGHQFTRADPAQRFEVVGVVADGRATELDKVSPLMVYVPYWFNNEGKSVLVVHTDGNVAAVVSALRRAIHDVDPEIAIADISPLERLIDRSLEGRRYQMWLFVAFGLAALAIAAIGIYATTAFSVSRRRREMNIRVALGARVSQVFGLVVRQSAVPVAIGLVVGCAGAVAIGSVIATLLFEVRTRDPLVLAGVVLLVGAVGLIASMTAAKQGLQIEPAAALREE